MKAIGIDIGTTSICGVVIDTEKCATPKTKELKQELVNQGYLHFTSSFLKCICLTSCSFILFVTSFNLFKSVWMQCLKRWGCYDRYWYTIQKI